MTGGGHEHECSGELLERERRGQLSASDRLALGAHLETCASCSLARQVHADFDDVTPVQVEDFSRIERLSTSARRWNQRRMRPEPHVARRRRRLRGLMVSLAALLFVAGTASGTVWLWRHPVGVADGETTATARPPARIISSVRRRRAPPVVPALPAAETAAPVEPVAPPAAEPVVAPAPARLAGRASSLRGAATLLRQASEARQQGDVDHAVSLYRRLQHDFRDTPEAVLSSVPFGGLLLARRLPQAALGQFDLYLASSRGGVLIPEALYGRGRALAALGHGQEEERTWRRLIRDFPNSAYALHARRRLVELE